MDVRSGHDASFALALGYLSDSTQDPPLLLLQEPVVAFPVPRGCGSAFS
jgi:hypothetical protein